MQPCDSAVRCARCIFLHAMVKKYVPKAAKEKVAELNLLLDLARGKKTFEQVVSDATDVMGATMPNTCARIKKQA